MTETIPPGWRRFSLKEVADLVGGGTPDRSVPRYFGGDVSWVTPTDLPPIGEVRELGEVEETISEEGLRNSSARLLSPGTVLFSSRASIGKIAVTNRSCATNQGFTNFLPRDGTVDPWFLAYYLCHSTSQIVQLAGETTYKEVSRGKLKEFPIILPPLCEQRRIVERIKECLSRVDEIKRLREETREEVEQSFSSLLAEFFDSAWPCKTLGSLTTDIRNGWSGKERKDGNPTKMLRLSSVHSRTIDPTESKDILLDTTDIEAFRVVKDDVFVVRGNGSKHLVGRSAIADSTYDNVVFNDLLIRLRFSSDMLPRFANYALRCPLYGGKLKSAPKPPLGYGRSIRHI
jgi:type I restriction enzyme S subunit